jgi:hypothetical protein
MNIRRPVAGLFIALAVLGGPATLTACGDPAGLDRNDGDSSDNDTGNTSGNNPADVSQGGVPTVDNDPEATAGNESRDANENGDNN